MTRILVTLDGSAIAEDALPHAVHLADRYGAELLLLNVIEQRYPMTELVNRLEPDYYSGQVGLQLDYLRAVQARLETPRVAVRLMTASGHPADEILRVARDEACAAIVMSSHGRRGLTRWLLGSATDRVMRSAPCPVMVTRAASGPSPRYRRILVPLNGTPASEQALVPAGFLASADGAELVLVRVLSFPSPIFCSSEIPSSWADMTLRELEHKCEEYLREQVRRLKQHGLKVSTVLRHGSPPERILEEDADLIVMATAARGPLGRAMFGTVSERVVHHAPVPVLLVRGEGALVRRTTLLEETASL